jgi:hypothetical protein
MARKRKSPTPETVDKENAIIELRRSGETWQRIAQVVGYANASGAQKAYMRAVARVQREPIEAIFDMELERLDRIQRAYWKPAIVDLNTKAADIVLKVMDRRAKLLGLEAPAKIDVSAEVVTYDGSIIEQQANLIIDLVRNNRGQASIMGSGTSPTGTDT